MGVAGAPEVSGGVIVGKQKYDVGRAGRLSLGIEGEAAADEGAS